MILSVTGRSLVAPRALVESILTVADSGSFSYESCFETSVSGASLFGSAVFYFFIFGLFKNPVLMSADYGFNTSAFVLTRFIASASDGKRPFKAVSLFSFLFIGSLELGSILSFGTTLSGLNMFSSSYLLLIS